MTEGRHFVQVALSREEHAHFAAAAKHKKLGLGRALRQAALQWADANDGSDIVLEHGSHHQPKEET